MRRVKTCSLLLIITCLLYLDIPVLANNIPAPSDTSLASVYNVEEGLEVTAYKIVGAEYDDNGITGYSPVNTDITIDDIFNITAGEIRNIINDGLGSYDSVKMTEQMAERPIYQADLSAGCWLVRVAGSNDSYNPMLIWIYYSAGEYKGTIEDFISLDQKNIEWSLKSSDAWGKYEPPSLEKKIIEDEEEYTSCDASIDEMVNLRTQTRFPLYDSNEENPSFIIMDELSEGLTIDHSSIIVKIGDLEIQPREDQINYMGNGFELNLSDIALENSGKKIEIYYDAIPNDKVQLNFSPNISDVSLFYSNSGKESTLTDRTYIYSFGIDSPINGVGSTISAEVLKVGEREEENEQGAIEDSRYPLAGASFKLQQFQLDENGEAVYGNIYEAVSSETGSISFKGLACGSYIFKETAAPMGYGASVDEHFVLIEAEYKDDGSMKSYTITIDGENISKYEVSDSGEIQIIKSETTVLINKPVMGVSLAAGGNGNIGIRLCGLVLLTIIITVYFHTRYNTRKRKKN